MTRVAVIIHRWSGSPGADWYPWAKGELEKRGFAVLVPEMPTPDAPNIETWVNKLKEILAGNAQSELLLIGHSVGCQTIIRTLQDLDLIVNNAIFVAGWLDLVGLDNHSQHIANPWVSTPIDFEAVEGKLARSTAIFSTNDPYVALSNEKIFEEKLGSQVVELTDRGHFDEDSNTKTLPEILNYV